MKTEKKENLMKRLKNVGLQSIDIDGDAFEVIKEVIVVPLSGSIKRYSVESIDKIPPYIQNILVDHPEIFFDDAKESYQSK